MRQRFNRWWCALTLWALRQRREFHERAHEDEVVAAILTRQSLDERLRKAGKEAGGPCGRGR